MQEETHMVEETKTSEETRDSAPSQETKPQRSEKEKAEFNLKRLADEAKQHGIDPAEVLGIKPIIKIDSTVSDDEPLTVGKLREIQRQDTKKTALEMAQQIQDEQERNETIALLNRLDPSGDAQKDFSIAHSAVTAERTRLAALEVARRSNPSKNASGGTQVGKQQEDFTPTPQEEVFMRPPYNMSKEKIIKLRQKQDQG